MKNIDLELIEKLAENMNEHSLTEISLETGEQKLVLKKEKKVAEVVTVSAPQKTVVKTSEKVEKKEKASAEGVTGNAITSPMVGTFYRSPAPGAEVFVQEGQNINIGDPVCIIEAMKMMNELKAPVSGEIVSIKGENGKAVEFDQVLFEVKEC